MSSTNRSGSRLEHASDYYVTPQTEIRHFLTEFKKDLCLLPLAELYKPDYIQMFKGARILDPAAGGDVKHMMSYPAAINQSWLQPHISNLLTLDVREDSRADMKKNFLTTNFTKEQFDIIITNPPFFFGIEYIRKSLELVRDGGLVILLLRLNFFGSDKRRGFLQENMPFMTYVHSRRMSFTDDKKTDSIEYMHAVWVKGRFPAFTMLRII